ncbi:MAG: YicC family protein [Bacteroidales bacterium]|nr:YicC family protein [Bacteroidales bacterium]
MTLSMTGYGKGTAFLQAGKLTVEIRSLNSKNGADINLKSSLIPKEKDIEIRKLVKERLDRGTIDVFISLEASAESAAESREINIPLAKEYYRQASLLASECGQDKPDFGHFLESALRIPDVITSKQVEIINEENWPLVVKAFDDALTMLTEFRKKEGAALEKDLRERVNTILGKVDDVEKFAAERVQTIKERILARFEELSLEVDSNRLESEMIFYLEKLDINEETVRLRQHCAYFIQVIENEPFAGRKLGFIAQEMGREINTTGSKANHTGIQKIVVQMKDELEKIKEQSCNVL